MKEKISIIVPCYNCETTIIQCYNSILGSNYENYEVILVDDCSTDNTFNIIKKFENFNTFIIRSDVNKGPAFTRNLGASNATGSFLLFIDSDTELFTDTLDIFYNDICIFDAVVGIYDSVSLNTGFSQNYKSCLYHWLLSRSGKGKYDQFSASCAGIRIEAFKNLNGFDVRFPPGLDFENEEFGHRISDKYNMILNPLMKVKHHFPGSIKMTKTFFLRTSLWMEMYTIKRKASPKGGTFNIGAGTMTLFSSIITCIFSYSTNSYLLLYISIFLYCIYTLTYINFYFYLVKSNKNNLLSNFILNHYYSLVITAGAVFGLIRSLLGFSRIRKLYIW
jgi:glycosyltransferase involved in cell wall biosynthesis